MIISATTCMFFGKDFSPERFERETGRQTREKNEPSEGAYGSCIVDIPDFDLISSTTAGSLRSWIRFFRERGATSCKLFCRIPTSDHQCNFDINFDVMEALAEFDVDVCISVQRDDALVALKYLDEEDMAP